MDLVKLQAALALIKDAASIILPLLGVWVGAGLAKRSADSQFLKKERLTGCVELLNQLKTLREEFGRKQKMSKFRRELGLAGGFDFLGAAESWNDNMDELYRIELKVKLLGGGLSDAYRQRAKGLIDEMDEAISNDAVTEREWDGLSLHAGRAIDALLEVAQKDLEVPTARNSMNLGPLFIRRRAAPQP